MAKIKQVKMKEEKNNIWGLLIGILMVLGGVYVWFNPAIALMALSLYLGAILIGVGVGYIMVDRAWKTTWQTMLGVLNVILGIIFIARSDAAMAVIPILLAIWALSAGIVKAVTAWQLKQIGVSLWPLPFTAGLVGIVFGMLVLFWPALGAIAITVLIGSYLVLYGALDIASYFLIKKR